jgi:large repetitive protein
VALTYTVPDSRGAQSTVDVLVGGQVNRTFNERGAQSHVITVPDDDHVYAVSLRVCNEFDRCSQSSAQSVQAYGPLRGAITGISANPNGPDMSYTITGNTNGRSAVLRVDRGADGSIDETIPLSSGPFTTQTQNENIGYDRTEQVRVTIVDPNLDRGTDSVRASGTAGSPPQAHVTIGRGSLCNDSPGSNAPRCGQGGDPNCTDPSCGFVQLTLDSFVDEFGNPNDATCRPAPPYRFEWNWQPGRSWSLGGGTTQLDAYFGTPGAELDVTCQDDDQTATGAFTWPAN